MASSIDASWGRIIAWLRANAPPDAIDPFPESSRAAVEAVAAEIGVPFPPQLVDFHAALHFLGSSSALPAADDDWMAFTPLLLEELRAEWKSQRDLVAVGEFADLSPQPDAGIADAWWHPGWIPFAGNGGGDLFCIDTAPATGGVVGQVVAHSHESGRRRLLAPSLEAYLETLADRTEQGEFVFDPTYGSTPAPAAEEEDDAADDRMTGMTEWHYDYALRQGEEAFKNKDYALCVAHLARFEPRLEKLPATRLAFARKKIAESR